MGPRFTSETQNHTDNCEGTWQAPPRRANKRTRTYSARQWSNPELKAGFEMWTDDSYKRLDAQFGAIYKALKGRGPSRTCVLPRRPSISRLETGTVGTLTAGEAPTSFWHSSVAHCGAFSAPFSLCLYALRCGAPAPDRPGREEPFPVLANWDNRGCCAWRASFDPLFHHCVRSYSYTCALCVFTAVVALCAACFGCSCRLRSWRG